MITFLTIIAVVVIFSLIVIIHEYGHFAQARRAGVKVLEFGFGFPPRLFKKKVGDTLYTINAIPFGGFVKLHGEDSTDPKMVKDPESFVHQSTWVRSKIVIAGVVMNFLLAVFLLTIGFIFGIEPLLVSQDDLYAAIDKGIVQTGPGVYVSKVDQSLAQSGITPGDQIIAINDVPVTSTQQVAPLSKKAATKDVDLQLRAPASIAVRKVHVPLLDGNSLGIELKPLANIPRLTVFGVKEGGAASVAGFKKGDAILRVDGKQIYTLTDFQDALFNTEKVEIEFLRDTQVMKKVYNQNFEGRVVITDVLPNSAALQFGFQKGDRIVSISGKRVITATEVQEIVSQSEGAEKEYTLVRNDSVITLKAKIAPKTKLGISLSEVTFYNRDDFSLYSNGVVTSLLEIGDIKLGPWDALKQAMSESVRLTGVTITAFINTIRSLVGTFSVPGDIGGPVQIAYYTHTFVQEGFFALLRFTALLSLSLAVMNVLPIPALDGGRLFFILVEAVTGRKVSARFESLIHMIGFVLLMLMIVVITYSDIVKLF